MDVFDAAVRAYMAERPILRIGQASYIALEQNRYGWVWDIQGTDLDPFYVDANLPAFRVWLADKFEAEYAQQETP